MEKKFCNEGDAYLKVNVLKKAPNELKIEIEGAGHTLCNLLQKKLLENEGVEIAGYDVPHPLASNPVFYIRTKGKIKPEEALKQAIEKARKMSEELKKEFDRAIKET